jgi:hypothetical protein
MMIAIIKQPQNKHNQDLILIKLMTEKHAAEDELFEDRTHDTEPEHQRGVSGDGVFEQAWILALRYVCVHATVGMSV